MSWHSRGVFASIALACALPCAWPFAALAAAPNIVFILADDLDQAAAAEMPLVKANITDAGTNFRRHYVSLSLCCPSRVTTLMGQFAHNTGVFTNGGKKAGGGFDYVYSHQLEASTVATWLQSAGYKTALFGKYLNGYPNAESGRAYIPPGWSKWVSPIDGNPYVEFDYTLNVNGEEVAYGHKKGEYLTDVLSRKAVKFIEDAATKPDKPFFLYLAPYAPHFPATPAPRHAGLFDGALAPRTPAFNEPDVSDKPRWLSDSPMLDDAQIAEIDALYRKRRESLLAVDEMVRDVVLALQASGQLENTYVIFTSDNGYHQGQHRLDSGKMTAYEEDLYVPLSVRGPGVPVGANIDFITSNVDYASTFTDIAGTVPGIPVDGRSLLPFLQGTTPPSWRQALLLEHKVRNEVQDRTVNKTLEPNDPADDDEKDNIQPFFGLRMANGRTYVEYSHRDCEIYDNDTDPYQERNICVPRAPGEREVWSRWLGCLKNLGGETLRSMELAPPDTPCGAQAETDED